MRYVKEGWPHGTDSNDVLHYISLEDSLVTKKVAYCWNKNCHTSQTQGPGTAAGTPGELRDAADEASGPLSGTLATY